MAIFSLNHSALGKSHKGYSPGVAAAHANYITRESTCSKLIGERLPTDRQQLKTWLHDREMSDRKNARVIDKLMIALPRELNAEQRDALLHDYCEHITQGRANWAAAIHDRDKDAHNPHAHVIIRDRDAATDAKVLHTTAGKKVVAAFAARGITLDPMTTERFREEWEIHANAALERAGFDARIDRRSNIERGIEDDPTIHVGPKNRILDAKEYRPGSEPIMVPKSFLPHEAREVRYPEIDQGRTRAEYNREIELRNQARQRRHFVGIEEPSWTSRGGMVAQQRSALEFFEQSRPAARAG